MTVAASRQKELRSSLELQLEEETAKRGFRVNDRIAWLTDRLAEYVDRWLGFCAVSDGTPRQNADSVLFAAVEVTTELLNSELRRSAVTPRVGDSWQRVQSAVQSVKGLADATPTWELRESIAGWQTAISPTPKSG